MNSLNGHIEEVNSNGNISLVSVNIGKGLSLRALVIENTKTAPYLKKDYAVKLLFKETEVTIAFKEGLQIGIQNQIPCRIDQFEMYPILTEVKLLSPVGPFTAILGTEEFKSLQLKEDMEVIALIRSNEIMMSGT